MKKCFCLSQIPAMEGEICSQKWTPRMVDVAAPSECTAFITDKGGCKMGSFVKMCKVLRSLLKKKSLHYDYDICVF